MLPRGSQEAPQRLDCPCSGRAPREARGIVFGVASGSLSLVPYLLPDSRYQNTVRTCGLGLAPTCQNSAASLQIEPRANDASSPECTASVVAELPAGVVVRIKKGQEFKVKRRRVGR